MIRHLELHDSRARLIVGHFITFVLVMTGTWSCMAAARVSVIGHFIAFLIATCDVWLHHLRACEKALSHFAEAVERQFNSSMLTGSWPSSRKLQKLASCLHVITFVNVKEM
jgi:hypothetical protein